jgi:peptidyl-prolyl cis-trans isomerase SurA
MFSTSSNRVLSLGLAALTSFGSLAPTILLAADPVKTEVPKTEVRIIEEIVAKVNSDIVTKTELDREARKLDDMGKQQGAPPNIAELIVDRKKHILRDRIDQLLLVQKAKDLNINVDADVNKYISNIQLKTKISDPDEFAKLILKETGQTFEDYKQDLRNQIMTQRVIGQEVRRNITVPREEVKKYYDEHATEFVRKDQLFLRELLVAATRADAEKRAKDLQERAKRGERFTELVRDNSDAVTAKDEGELPPYEKGMMPANLENMLWDKEKGFVTEPIKLDNGWLILRVEEHTRPGQATFEEVENRLSDQLAAPQMETAIRKYLTELRVPAFLEIREGYIDTGAAAGKDTTWTDPAQLKPETISKDDLMNYRRRRLLFMPIPFTKKAVKPIETAAVTPAKAATKVEAAGESKSKKIGPK